MSQACYKVGGASVSVNTMNFRLITFFADFLGTPHHGSDVHFHAGPMSAPAACFDRGCEIPRLNV